MGGQLVKKAFSASFYASQRGDPMSANEQRVLLYMAALAMDDADEPRYWGGREALAEIALGRRIPTEPNAEKARQSILKSVSIATRKLVIRGAIRLEGGAHPGRRQEYVLTVDNCLPAAWSSEPEVPPSGTSGSTIGNVRFPEMERQVPPKDQETNRPNEKPKSPWVTPSPEPVENGAAA